MVLVDLGGRPGALALVLALASGLSGCGSANRDFASGIGDSGSGGSMDDQPTSSSGSSGNAHGGAGPSGGTAGAVLAEAGVGGEGGATPEARCTPGETQQCWEAENGDPLPPEPAKLQGSCRRGLRTCDSSGAFGACVGAVPPQEKDSCSVGGADDDCNGVPNENCTCTEGDTRACGTDVGNCKKGVQHCTAQTWGECEGAVKAATQDSCVVKGDDADCDGVVNGGCPCVGTESRHCNDCGTQACDAAARTWGACAATQSPAATRCASDSLSVQTCNGTGQWVSATCSTADTHCKSACQASDSAAKCVVAALDVDGDTYGDAKCVAAPGTDCDDMKAAVHPGAAELCDGIDNDCDGAVDLHDGLLLSGTNTLVSARSYLDLAWNFDAGNFGWLGNSTATTGLFFGTLSTAGILSSASDPLFASSSYYSGMRLAYSSGFGGFGAVYSWGNQAGSFSNWIYISSTGTAGGTYSLPSGQNASLATRQDADFLIANRDAAASTLYFGRIKNGLGYTSGSNVAEAALEPKIATSGALSAIVYQIKDTQTINWLRVNASLVMGAPSQLTDAGKSPDIIGMPSGYAVAWATATGLTYQVFDTGGTAVCGPTKVAFGDGLLDDQDAVALEPTAYGTVLLAADKGGHVGLYRFDAACALIDTQDIQPSVTSAAAPHMAVGGGKLAITWVDRTNAANNSYVRVLNEGLCK